MSEKIDVSLVLERYIPLNILLAKLNLDKKNLISKLEYYTIDDWEWNGYKQLLSYDSNVLTTGKILYFSKDNQFMGYYYNEKGNYILDISFDTEYIITFGDVDTWVDKLENAIKCIQNDIFLKYAYIGKETYVVHSDNYNEMINKSIGVIKWIIS
ncbi:MAG: hypothetical protein ACI4JK_13505 [Oscillospiraceae bacterium]